MDSKLNRLPASPAQLQGQAISSLRQQTSRSAAQMVGPRKLALGFTADGSSLSYPISHSLHSENFIASCRDLSGTYHDATITATDEDTVTVSTSTALSAGAYVVVLVG